MVDLITAGLKFIITGNGAQFVIMTGISGTQMRRVVSLASPEQFPPHEEGYTVGDQVLLG